MRVLIVGFEEAERSSIEHALAPWGARVTPAMDNTHAIAAGVDAYQAGKPFHAVIIHEDSCSVGIADVPGRYLAHAFAHDLRFILCSRRYSLAMKDEVLQTGFHALLPLPLDKQLLFAALHSTETSVKQDIVVYLNEYYARKEIAKRALRVLVAGGSVGSQALIAKILEQAGHIVALADSGELALDELQRAIYDVLIVGMRMSSMNGLDMVKALRFLQSKDDETPVIVQSADATVEEINECSELEIGAFLPEPVDSAGLLDAVLLLAEKRRQEKARQLIQAARPDNGGKQMIDLSTLAELEAFSSDSGFMPELIQGFIIDNDALLSQMRSALNTSQMDTFRDLLHGMKGNAASIGAEQLASLCSELHSADRRTLCGDPAKTWNRVAETLESTYAALAEYLKTRHSAVS